MTYWHRRLIAETRALQGLSDRIEDDPVGVELAARFLTSPTVATPDPSRGPAAAVDGPGIGAAGTAVRLAAGRAASLGEVDAAASPAVPTSEAAGSRSTVSGRPAASATTKAPGVSAPRASNSAAR